MDDLTTRCEGRTLMLDDRWGGFTIRCELDDGHDGEHQSVRSAHIPVAYLRWEGTYGDER